MTSQYDILVNATVQALLIALLREIEDGATVEELRDIMDSLLHYAQGNRTH
jgi:alkylhydroperoxidase/carboxymuconolactone decarboxylase family protein YurZ